MPPILISQQGDKLIYQNEDGSVFPVAASALSPDYMSALTSGKPLVSDPLNDILSLNQGGFSPEPQSDWQGSSGSIQPLQEPEVNMVPALPAAPPVQEIVEPTRIEKSFSQQGAGLKQEYAGIAEAAKNAAESYKQSSEDMMQTKNRLRMIQEDSDKRTDAQMQRIIEKQDEIEKMKVENPWAQASTLTKIGAAIAIGLGEQSAAYLGRENTALNIINKAIDDDVKLQMKRIDKATGELSNEKDYLSLVKQATTDRVTQELMLKTIGIEATENKIKIYGENAKTKQAQGQVQQLLGGLEQKKQQYEQEAMKRLVDMGKAQAEMAATQTGAPENMIPGVGRALTKDDALKAKDINESSMNFLKTLNDAIALREEFGSEVLNRDAVARGKSLGADLLLQVKALGQLGALSKSDIEDVINPLIPSDITEASTSTGARLQRAKEYVTNRVTAFYKSRGLTVPDQFLGTGERRVLPNGAEFLIQNGQAVPQNELAKKIVAAQKAAKQ